MVDNNSFLPYVGISVVSLITGIYLGRNLFQKSVKSVTKMRLPPKSRSSSTSSTNSEMSDIESDGEFYVDSKSLNDVPGEVRMVLVIRTDLNMTKGKIAAQCCHAAVSNYRRMSNSASPSYNLPLLTRWERGGQAKITLKCPGGIEELDELYAKAISMNINSCIIHDAGRTQIESGTATVLGLGPAPKLVIDQITSHLKLY